MTPEEREELSERILQERPFVWLAIEVGVRIIAIAVLAAMLAAFSVLGFVVANLILGVRP
jgi:hypothetical protein